MSRAPLHALQGFVLAAKLGNLTRAAEAAHLTVSALSHQMRGLETQLGRRLLERGARGVSLTEDGRQLLERIEPSLAAIERALQPCPARRDHVLCLSLLPSLSNSWLMPRLPDFLAEHPDLELSLRSESTLVDFNRDRDIDAALRFGPGSWPGVEAQHLFDDWITPVASPALIERLDITACTPLEQLPLLGDPAGRWSEWFRCFGGGHGTPRFVARFTDSESLHRAALEGLGVALGRLTMARPLLESGRLRALCNERIRAEYAHYLVWPPRSDDHAGFVAFRSWLGAQAARFSESLVREEKIPSSQDCLHSG